MDLSYLLKSQRTPPCAIDALAPDKYPWARDWMPGTKNYEDNISINKWVQTTGRCPTMFVGLSPAGAHPYCRGTNAQYREAQYWVLFCTCPEWGEDAVRVFGTIQDHATKMPIPVDERQTEWLDHMDGQKYDKATRAVNRAVAFERFNNTKAGKIADIVAEGTERANVAYTTHPKNKVTFVMPGGGTDPIPQPEAPAAPVEPAPVTDEPVAAPVETPAPDETPVTLQEFTPDPDPLARKTTSNPPTPRKRKK